MPSGWAVLPTSRPGQGYFGAFRSHVRRESENIRRCAAPQSCRTSKCPARRLFAIGVKAVIPGTPPRNHPRHDKIVPIVGGHRFNSGFIPSRQPCQRQCALEIVMNSPSFGYCPSCGAAVNVPGAFCASCGQRLPNSSSSAPLPQPQFQQPMAAAVPQGSAVICPFCRSTQVQAGKRGWKWTTGFIGSGNIVMTCLQCGKKFKPA